MMDRWFEIGLSNASFALIFAIVAMVVGIKAKHPHLAHMLWLLVFIKLVTPPIMMIPLPLSLDQQTVDSVDPYPGDAGQVTATRHFDERELPIAQTQSFSFSAEINSVLRQVQPSLAAIWLLGSGIVFAWSLLRVFRFNRLLGLHSQAAPPKLQVEAEAIASRLGLKAIPSICTTSARISPMVWWAGGRVRVVLPGAMLDAMGNEQWRWILAHEIAHVRRRDYLVRWLEWLACVCFWWNPVTWWARRNLRAMEEICCDALVLSSLKPTPRTYASSLLTAVECLVPPTIRPPAVASEINGGGFLERRFKMIIARKPNVSNPRWYQVCVLLSALVVLPLGFAVAQDFDAIERRLGESVSDGELTLEQAVIMIDALRKNTVNRAPGKERWSRDREKHHGIEGHLRMVGERLKAAVKAGKMTEEEAWAKWHAIKEKDIAPRLKAAVAEGHMSEEQSRGIWRGIEKAEIGERLKAAVAKGELTEEEARAKWETMEKEWAAKECAEKECAEKECAEKECAREAGLAGHYKRMGISDEAFDRIQRHLHENGIQREQLDEVMGAMLRVIYKVKSEGDDFELDPRLRDYFTGELGLTDQQVELVQGMARRVAHGMRDSNEQPGEENRDENRDAERSAREDARPSWDGIRQRIESAVERGDLTREEADAKYREIREQWGRERDNASDRRDDNSKRAGRAVWEGIRQRIEGAVERGDLTREEADAKYREIRERMGRERGNASDRRDGNSKRAGRAVWEGIRQRIEGAVERGDLTREEADARYRQFRERVAGEGEAAQRDSGNREKE